MTTKSEEMMSLVDDYVHTVGSVCYSEKITEDERNKRKKTCGEKRAKLQAIADWYGGLKEPFFNDNVTYWDTRGNLREISRKEFDDLRSQGVLPRN